MSGMIMKEREEGPHAAARARRVHALREPRLRREDPPEDGAARADHRRDRERGDDAHVLVAEPDDRQRVELRLLARLRACRQEVEAHVRQHRAPTAALALRAAAEMFTPGRRAGAKQTTPRRLELPATCAKATGREKRSGCSELVFGLRPIPVVYLTHREYQHACTVQATADAIGRARTCT